MAVTIRANDVKASNLLLLSLVFYTVGQVLVFIPAFCSHFSGTLIFIAFSLLPAIAYTWLIREGYRFAKVLFLVPFVVGACSYLAGFFGQQEATSRTILTLACAAPQAWAALIIFKDLMQKPVFPGPQAE